MRTSNFIDILTNGELESGGERKRYSPCLMQEIRRNHKLNSHIDFIDFLLHVTSSANGIRDPT